MPTYSLYSILILFFSTCNSFAYTLFWNTSSVNTSGTQIAIIITYLDSNPSLYKTHTNAKGYLTENKLCFQICKNDYFLLCILWTKHVAEEGRNYLLRRHFNHKMPTVLEDKAQATFCFCSCLWQKLSVHPSRFLKTYYRSALTMQLVKYH